MYDGIAIWRTTRGCRGPTRCLPSFKTTGRALASFRTILLSCRTVLLLAELIQAGIGFQPAGCSSRPVARALDCMPIPGAAMRFFAKFSERRNL